MMMGGFVWVGWVGRVWHHEENGAFDDSSSFLLVVVVVEKMGITRICTCEQVHRNRT